jgi:hypothetical protein
MCAEVFSLVFPVFPTAPMGACGKTVSTCARPLAGQTAPQPKRGLAVGRDGENMVGRGLTPRPGFFELCGWRHQ